MDAAKNAVNSFLHKDGKHTTHVHETMGDAVTNETRKEHRHENVTKAVDKEVHQDHYHHTVQPITAKETVPESHHHHVAGVEERNFEHGNDRDVKARLENERAKFQDTTTQAETRHTSTAAPTVSGEHVHHHVHEHVQPILHKEKIIPHVHHTTVPVHELHHNKAEHHATTSLPAVSLDQFKSQGGVLGGRGERTDFFEGEPRHMGGHHAPTNTANATSEFRQTGHHGLTDHGSSGATGRGSSGMTGSSTGTHHHGTSGTGLTGSNTAGNSGLTGSNTSTGTTSGLAGDSARSGGLSNSNTTSGATSGVTGNHSTRAGDLTGGNASHARTDSAGVTQDTTTKPSLLSRLNPLKDSDGDGKKGIMD